MARANGDSTKTSCEFLSNPKNSEESSGKGVQRRLRNEKAIFNAKQFGYMDAKFDLVFHLSLVFLIKFSRLNSLQKKSNKLNVTIL